MITSTKKPFNQRAFVALLAAFSGLGLPMTGVANHLLQMEQMTLRRHAWMAAHNTLAIIFVTAAVWHLILNRRTLLNHVRTASSRLLGISRETAYAGIIVAILLFVFVRHAFLFR
jgi:hypothetical protein